MKKTFIIAEIGVNHNGDMNLVYKLINVAKDSGANAVKFQTFKAKNLASKYALKAEYQNINIGNNDNSQYNMLEKLELSFNDFKNISEYCQKIGLEFISTPFDIESVNFLNKLNVSQFKIGSGDLTNYQLLKSVALTHKPIILSTGMSNLYEIKNSIKFIKKFSNSKLTLLHCISCYPTQDSDCNLLAINTMRDSFNLDIGFSDHTLGYEAAIISITLGATHLEKHFTLDKNMVGPDHKSSLSPDELKEYIKKIRQTEIMLGDGNKICQESEKKTKKLVRRSLALNKNKNKDDIICENDLIALRPDNNISANNFEQIIGKKLNKNLSKSAFINWSDLV